MPDLSKIQGRATQQDQAGHNRQNTMSIPDQPDAPKVQVVAGLREAIPDGSAAEDVRRVLGLANQTLDSFNGYTTAKQAQQDPLDAAKGVADQAAGQVDPELEKRSLAYSLAVGMANARDTALQAHVKAQDDANTYLAQNPSATLDDLNAHMEQSFRALVLDQGGKPIDFGHPEANAYPTTGKPALGRLWSPEDSCGPFTIHSKGAPMARRSPSPGGFDTLALSPQTSDPLLPLEDVARWLGLPRKTLLAWRRKRRGPKALKLGSRLIAYRTSAVEAWLDRLWSQAPF